MSSYTQHRLLPNGKRTTSLARYSKEWMELAQKMCPPGWRVLAYDPSILLGSPDNKRAQNLSLEYCMALVNQEPVGAHVSRCEEDGE